MRKVDGGGDKSSQHNRADDEDAHCKKVPADFDLNEPPPEEAGQETQGGGAPPEVAPTAAEGDEQNISSTLSST
nr:hypothetical protein Iba_chr08bCG1280 [Ipomoea batatas]